METTKNPTIKWAQRSNLIYLTLEVGDMKVEELSVVDDSFKISGTSGKLVYKADLQLYAKVKGEDKRQIATGRQLEFILPKAESGWWPRLLKSEIKAPWIKIDFEKWKDEDEVKEELEDDNDFGGGFPGMSGIDFSQFTGGDMGGLGGFDEDDYEEDDDENSDGEEVPSDQDVPESAADKSNSK